MNEVKLVFDIVGFLLILFGMLSLRWYGKELEVTKCRLKEKHDFIIIHTGSNFTLGDYKIISFDEGWKWWNFEHPSGIRKGWDILGPADPEAVKVILAFRELGDLRRAVDLNDPLDRQKLERAGFKIEKKEKQ